jgi:acyl-CoA thioesterase-1
MVSVPSGLVTCLLTSSARRTNADTVEMRSSFMKWVAMAVLIFSAAGTSSAAAPKPLILIMGDSLSAAYGIEVTSGWVALLDKRLAEQGYGYSVVNASVSGETTGGGRTRFPQLLSIHKPQIVVLELGANDGLRGLPVSQAKTNLQSMIETARQQGAQVVLAGMHMPPNYGPAYTGQFDAMYRDLAAQYRLPFVPFLLNGVALSAELVQADGLHPTAAAQPRLLDNVWPVLEPLLRKKK